ncbi:MAG: NnrS family protein [Flavobacteriaceae bacterium]
MSSSNDRSSPRNAHRAGDFSRDARGRTLAAPPILQYGFRPFFFLGALHAGVAIPVWLCVYFGHASLPSPFAGMQWHAHEMIFGYLGAVIAGFVLTAVPNWTGRLPLSGRPLAVLASLWIAGRIACLLSPDPALAMLADLAFPAVLAFAIWREVLAGRNWRNVPVALMITLFGLANATDHLANLGFVAGDLGQRLALGVAAMLISLIGGRIVPSFTRNWLAKRRSDVLPAPFGNLDKAALAMTAAGGAGWIALPGSALTGTVLLAAGTLLALRLLRWRGALAVSEPILLVLHLGYGWLAAALFLLGASMLSPAFPAASAIHALTAGAIGTMTLAVMTRASLGHTGREIVADRYVVAMYALVTAGAVARVAAPFSADWYLPLIAAGGGLWSAGFLLFALRFAPILWGRRLAGQVGQGA